MLASGLATIMASSIEAAGVRFHGPTVDSPPVRLAFFSDPDGYPLYLSQDTGRGG